MKILALLLFTSVDILCSQPSSHAPNPLRVRTILEAVSAQSKVLPRLSVGADWQTTVVLFNPGSAALSFQQWFFGEDGKPAKFVIQSPLATETLKTSALQGVLAANSALSFTVSSLTGSSAEGWSFLSYSGGTEIGGYATLRHRAPGGSFFEVSIPLSSLPHAASNIPFDNTATFRSQLTLVNPAANRASRVKLTYFDPHGSVVLIDSVTLQPGQQTTLSIPDNYPDLANKTGTVSIQGDTDLLAVAGLRYSAAYGAIAPLPAFTSGASTAPR